MTTINNSNLLTSNNKTIIPTVSDKTHPEINEENKNNSYSRKKVLIGAGAAIGITSAVIGGIMYSKKTREVNQTLDTLKNKIDIIMQALKENDKLKNSIDFKKFEERISKIINNAKSEKTLNGVKANLKEVIKELGSDIAIELLI